MAVIDAKFAFSDRLMVADGELLQTVRFRHDEREESAALAFPPPPALPAR